MPTPNYDAWKTTPPEPDIVGQCCECHGDLYANCEYTYDRDNDEYFCDDGCYVEHKREAGIIVSEPVTFGGDDD